METFTTPEIEENATPLAVSIRNKDTTALNVDIHPLPSSRFRFSKWNEIDKMNVTSDMLKCPRVRQAPKGFNVFEVETVEQQNRKSSREKVKITNKERQKRQSRLQVNKHQLEKWENCENINLSFQELGHSYQLKDFTKVLNRLVQCETIQLMDNSLSDLSKTVFPRCKELYLQRNNFKSFKRLPQLFMCEHLSLQQNNIESLKDIHCPQMSNVKSLVLLDNPVSLMRNYRARVFKELPKLVLLDYLPRQPEDFDGIEELSRRTTNCTVS